MKRILSLSMALMFGALLHTAALAQGHDADPGGVQVSGEGEMKVQPDLMKTTINVQTEAREFQEAVNGLRNKTDQIVRHLQASGYDKASITVLRMSVNKQYDYRNGERIDRGYMATQSIQLTSDYSAEKLGRVVDVMGKSPVDVPFSFSFSLKDKTLAKYREQLMTMAVKDARQKAEILVKAAGVKLKSIRKISYDNVSPYQPVMRREMMAMDAIEEQGGSVNLEVQEMTLREQVHIEWFINE